MVHLDAKSVFIYILHIKRKINMQNLSTKVYVYSNENKLPNVKVSGKFLTVLLKDF